MFTGIVQGVGEVIKIDKSSHELAQTNWIKLPKKYSQDLEIGASIANNGCCLTVSQIKDDGIVAFDLINETLTLTNLKLLKAGDLVNIERSMKVGDEIGGHLMSGHILQTVKIIEIIKSKENQSIIFALPKNLQKYIFTKGFVGLDGCSLTIGEVTNTSFAIHLIPETLNLTIFKNRQVNDLVNIEIDNQTQVIVDTVTKIMTNKYS